MTEENQQDDVWISKDNGEVIRVGMAEFKGRAFLDIRTCYEAEPHVFRPTKKGITIAPEQIDELLEAIHKVKEKE